MNNCGCPKRSSVAPPLLDVFFGKPTKEQTSSELPQEWCTPQPHPFGHRRAVASPAAHHRGRPGEEPNGLELPNVRCNCLMLCFVGGKPCIMKTRICGESSYCDTCQCVNMTLGDILNDGAVGVGALKWRKKTGIARACVQIDKAATRTCHWLRSRKETFAKCAWP